MTGVTRFLEWALDLDQIRMGTDAPLFLEWGREVPAWVLLCFALVVLTHVALVYRRERTTVVRRTVLAVLRCAIIAVVAAMFCEPSLVLQRNRVEASHVAVLVDTSASMGTRDHDPDELLRNSGAPGVEGAFAAGTDSSGQQSRLDLVRAALLDDDGAALRRLTERNGIHLLTFSGGVEGLAYVPPSSAERTFGGDLEGSGLGPIVEALRSAVPTGLRTDVAGAIAELIEPSSRGVDVGGGQTTGRRPSGDRLAAVILFSDGQSTLPIAFGADGAGALGGPGVTPRLGDALASFADRDIPIYPVRIGSTVPPRDVAISSLRSAEAVFVDDEFTIEAQLSARGLSERTTVLVSLVDERGTSAADGASHPSVFPEEPGQASSGMGGTIVATRSVELDPDASSTIVELRAKPARPGITQYRVEVAPLPGERVTHNNADWVDVKVIDDRLRVLYVEAYPRYEYRYLKNAFMREKNMDLSVLLIEADEQFVQEGTEPIRRFPETPEELGRYDVVFFGDVDPRAGWISAAQMNMLLDFVGNEGGGFALIAGERSAPQRFLGTPLERLVPVGIDPVVRSESWAASDAGRRVLDSDRAEVGRSGAWIEDARSSKGFRPRLTSDGQLSRVFRFAADREQSRRLFESLPELYWVARTLGPKPGATVLAEHPTWRTASAAMPVVVVGQYGAGKIFFQATDDTWRWRRHTGELVHDAYWVQVARDLMRGGRLAQGRRYTLRTDRRVFEYGAPVQARVEILDRKLLREQEDTVELTVTGLGKLAASDESRDGRLETIPNNDSEGQVVARFNVYRVGPGAALFEGTFVPPRPGRFSLDAGGLSGRGGYESIGGPSGASRRRARIRVNRPDLETRRLEANHAVLERIAAATGGTVVELDRLTEAFGRLGDRSVQIPDDVTETLWDSKLVLVVFVSMISMEWGLRKLFGLL